LSHQETKHDVLTVAPMGMLLVVPDGDILASAIVVNGSMALRTASLRDTTASGTSRGGGVQPGEYRSSRGVTFPPGRLSGGTGRCALPELKGVLAVGGFEEGDGRHLEKSCWACCEEGRSGLMGNTRSNGHPFYSTPLEHH